MRNSKIYKFTTVVLAIAFGVTIAYAALSNRHKAIIKTQMLHGLNVIDADWETGVTEQSYQMISPEFWIDGIYKSMEGPKASNYVRLSADSTLLFITDFHVRAYDGQTGKRLSNDFICHTNVDFNDASYFSHFALNDRIGVQYPRLTSLSHGLEDFAFPEGYGVPMKGNEWLFVTTQALNHNIEDADILVRHEVTIGHSRNLVTRPLMSRTAFIMLPYDKKNPYREPTDPASNQCVPVETKNHAYEAADGQMMSGHWVIPPGNSSYKSSISNQLMIKDSLRLHASALHVHPFATALELYDATDGKIIFRSDITNHKDRIGLAKVPGFSSVDGVWLFAGHDYEIRLEVNNTTAADQDMMASAFLFFYDAELDANLKRGG